MGKGGHSFEFGRYCFGNRIDMYILHRKYKLQKVW